MCHPTRSPLHRGSSASPSQQLRATSFSFLSPVSGSGVGGRLARICREATQPCPWVGGWPRPSPEQAERCHGHGQQGSGAGWDGRGLLWVGARVGWVQGGESTYRPHRCSQPTPQQVSVTASSPPSSGPCQQPPSCAHPGLAAGWHGINPAQADGPI